MTLEQTIPTGFPDAPQSKFKQWTLKVKFFLGSLFYLTYALYAYRYSRKRDRIEGNEISLGAQNNHIAPTTNYKISAPFRQAYFKGEFLVSSL